MGVAKIDVNESRKSEGSHTGTQDTLYNLISVLYHSLQGAEQYDRYVHDAEREGDADLTHFFADVRDSNKVRAERAKLLLARRMGRTLEMDQVDKGSKESFPASDPPAHQIS